jgi:hypothetical protein
MAPGLQFVRLGDDRLSAREVTDMKEDEEVPGYEGQVSCDFCRKHIPRSEAYQPEAQDYVAYFCGLECYQAWEREQAGEHGGQAGETD